MLQGLRSIRSQLRFALKYPSLYILCYQLKKAGKTYLSCEKLESLVGSFLKLRSLKPAINVAEFGVGRGGSALLLYSLVTRFGGHLTLYDLFGRIPPPSDRDGAKAAQRYLDILHKEKPTYYGNIENLQEKIEFELNAVGADRRYTVVKGRYEDTLSSGETTLEQI